MSKRYARLIKFALEQNRSRCEGTYELHHIVPRCMGGTNEPLNLVLLTPREHFIAHVLLAKSNKGHSGLVYAVMMFKGGSHGTYYNSRLYDAVRRRGFKFSEEHCRRLAISKIGSDGNNRRWWTIIDPSGQIHVTRDRKKYCFDRGLNWESVKSMTQKKPEYKGYKFIKGQLNS